MKRQRIHRDAKKRSGRALWLIPAAGLILALALCCCRGLPQALAMVAVEASPGRERGDCIDAPYLDQREKYPTGCESVCAVMDLQYYGVDLSVEEFIDGYLPLGDAPHVDEQGNYVGCDPREAFPGNPYEESGWGCYSPVIEKALVRVLEDTGRKDLAVARLDGSTLEDLYGRYVSQGVPVLLWATIDMEGPSVSQTFTMEDLYGRYVSQGVPVLLWATIDMEGPSVSQTFTIQGTGESFDWVYPMHCLLWVGEAGDSWLFHDPLAGEATPYRKDRVERAYQGLGCQAVALVPDG